jgi:hypothetical protein
MLAKAALFIAAVVGAPILASSSHAQQAVTAARRGSIQRRSRLQQGAAQFRIWSNSTTASRSSSCSTATARLGLKDYFAYMNQGISVDYGIVSPAQHVTFQGALHRRAVPVPRPRPLEQGARRRPVPIGRIAQRPT